MKTRKFFLTLLALTSSMVILAQLNPIKNLYFHPWYEMPYNFFQLNWHTPDSLTTDTLVGYNIYRNNVLYRFQTDSTMYHTYFTGSNCPESFLGGDGVVTPPFYIHVTAVYNSSHIESLYNDSAQCSGLALNTKEIQNNNIKIEISPNPLSDNSTITIQLDHSPKDEYLIILNEQGKVIKKMLLVSRITKINISEISINKGLYFCCIINKGQVITNKMVKIN